MYDIKLWTVIEAGTNKTADVKDGEGTFGPFFYSTEATAQEAVDTLSFHEKESPDVKYGVDAFSPRSGADVYQDVIESGNDAFCLDGVWYPTSPYGLGWIDGQIEMPFWGERVRGWQLHGAENFRVHLDVIAEGLENHNEIRLVVTPELDGQTFWMHTTDMDRFDRPDLEVRNVPANMIAPAGRDLRSWAAYSIENEIGPDETMEGHGPIPHRLRAISSPDPFWEERNLPCLRIVIDQVTFSCGSDDHQDREAPPDGTVH